MNRIAPILVINALAGAVPAFASDVVPASWQMAAVDDDVLAHATGKYADQNMITGFQLVMQSQWQTPNGANLFATGTLDVSRNSNNTYSASTSANTGILPGVGNAIGSITNTVSGATSVLVNGVAQITQVAGNQNSAANTAVIQFAPASTSYGGAGQGQTSSSTTSGNMSASVAITSAGVQLALTTPFGNVEQSIVGGAGSPINRVMQVVQVAGNAQSAVNTLQLNLQTSPLTANALRQIGISSAMTNMVSRR